MIKFSIKKDRKVILEEIHNFSALLLSISTGKKRSELFTVQRAFNTLWYHLKIGDQ